VLLSISCAWPSLHGKLRLEVRCAVCGASDRPMEMQRADSILGGASETAAGREPGHCFLSSKYVLKE
jgi:hypothetical protein